MKLIIPPSIFGDKPTRCWDSNNRSAECTLLPVIRSAQFIATGHAEFQTARPPTENTTRSYQQEKV